MIEVQGEEVGSIADIDLVAGHIDIRKRGDAIDIQPHSVFFHERYQPEPMPESLMQFGEQVLSQIQLGNSLPKSARVDLLSQSAPRLKTLSLPLDPRIKNPATVLALDLDESVLAIQGPPGTGKTHIGSEMIAELAGVGKTSWHYCRQPQSDYQSTHAVPWPCKRPVQYCSAYKS